MRPTKNSLPVRTKVACTTCLIIVYLRESDEMIKALILQLSWIVENRTSINLTEWRPRSGFLNVGRPVPRWADDIARVTNLDVASAGPW